MFGGRDPPRRPAEPPHREMQTAAGENLVQVHARVRLVEHVVVGADQGLALAAAPAGNERGEIDEARAETRHFPVEDRKSTRLNSSHSQISYAVFCLKKKKTNRP